MYLTLAKHNQSYGICLFIYFYFFHYLCFDGVAGTFAFFNESMRKQNRLNVLFQYFEFRHLTLTCCSSQCCFFKMELDLKQLDALFLLLLIAAAPPRVTDQNQRSDCSSAFIHQRTPSSSFCWDRGSASRNKPSF